MLTLFIICVVSIALNISLIAGLIAAFRYMKKQPNQLGKNNHKEMWQ